LWSRLFVWGRLSSLRPAFQPAWAPLTQCLSCNRSLLRPLQHAALLATQALLVEQAARLAMPAVTPAERHNPQRYGSSHAIQPARLRTPPQAAPSFPSPCPPCSLWFAFSVPSMSCPMWGRLSSLRPAFEPAWAPLTQCLSCNRSLLRPLQHAALLATQALLVEQAARLAMPAVTPAERHNPQRYGSSHAIQPARLRTPPQAAPSFPSPCPPCSLWFAFSVPSMSCPMWGRLSSLRPAFEPALAPLTHCPHPIAHRPPLLMRRPG